MEYLRKIRYNQHPSHAPLYIKKMNPLSRNPGFATVVLAAYTYIYLVACSSVHAYLMGLDALDLFFV